MMTVRQLERLWNEQDYARMLRSCLEMRPEGSARLAMELSRPEAAAAMALIRLDELSQSYVPFCARLARTIVASQQADGGWGDALTTAVCLRALIGCKGEGLAIRRGMDYLGNLQKDEGIWPKLPIRRTAADPFVSAYVLFCLMHDARFAAAVRWSDAVHWFEEHERELDPEAARLWQSIRLRRRAREVVWS